MRILLVEDDRKAARLLARGLQEEGFVVDVAHSAEEGEDESYAVDYDAIVLDWMLPGKQGIDFCRDLRARGIQTPVLMLTARDATTDRVAGLNTGADDYLIKPFEFEELLARIRALLRRSDISRPLVLTPKEYAILLILLRQAGDVISRARLAEQIWQADLIGIDNLIDVHVRNLRGKVDAPGLPPLIHTVRGRGFRLAENNGG